MALQRGFFAGQVNKAFVHHLVFKSGLYVGTTSQQSQHDQLSDVANSYVATKAGKHDSKDTDDSYNIRLRETLVLLAKRESQNPNVKLTCSNLVDGQFVLSFHDKYSPKNDHKIHFVVQKEKGHVLLRSVKDGDNFVLFCKQYWNEVEKLGFVKVDMLVKGLKAQIRNKEAHEAEARILNAVQPKVLSEKEKVAKLAAEMQEAKAYDASKAAALAAAASPVSPSSSISSGVSSAASDSESPVSLIRRATVEIDAFSPRENIAAMGPLPLIRVKS